MYRRPKFLEILLEIREEMSREAEYDVDSFAEMLRSKSGIGKLHSLSENENGIRQSKNKIEVELNSEFDLRKND